MSGLTNDDFDNFEITARHNSQNDEGGAGKVTKNLLKLAKENAMFFRDQFGQDYAFIDIKGHHESVKLRSRDFKDFLLGLYFQKYNKPVSSSPVTTVIDHCSSESFMSGKKFELHNRICSDGNSIFYDIGNENWEVVEINKSGSHVISPAAPMFVRYDGIEEQIFERGGEGNLDKFLSMWGLNENELMVNKVWIVSAFIPTIPHAISIKYGPEGSAKSTLDRCIRKTIDPNVKGTVSLPKNKNELPQMLQHNYSAPFDNVTYLDDEYSDMLCRASTGEGLSKRMLYSDEEDIIFKYRRFISINGINNVANNPDLLSRCLLLYCEPISDTQRKTEEDLMMHFEELRPKIVAECFDVVSRAMSIYPTLELKELTRMADFAKWGEAIARSMGYEPLKFINILQKKLAELQVNAVSISPVGNALTHFLGQKQKVDNTLTTEWIGTTTDLLNVLEQQQGYDVKDKKKPKGWPGNANALSRELGKLTISLQKVGIKVDRKYERTGSALLIKIEKITAPDGHVPLGEFSNDKTQENEKLHEEEPAGDENW